jgi:hypothetical protein
MIIWKFSYSRQLTIIEAANEYTRNQLQTRGGKALFLIKPSGYLHMGKIIQVIEKAGLTQLHTSMVKLTREDVRLIQSILPSSTSERYVCMYVCMYVCILLLYWFTI